MLTRWLMRVRVANLRRHEKGFIEQAEREAGAVRTLAFIAAADMRSRLLAVEERQRAMTKG